MQTDRVMSNEELVTLSPADQELILAALTAAHDGPYFEDWEFQTLMGVTKAEVAEVIDSLRHLSAMAWRRN